MNQHNTFWLAVGQITAAARTLLEAAGSTIIEGSSTPCIVLVAIYYLPDEVTMDDLIFRPDGDFQVRSTGLQLYHANRYRASITDAILMTVEESFFEEPPGEPKLLPTSQPEESILQDVLEDTPLFSLHSGAQGTASLDDWRYLERDGAVPGYEQRREALIPSKCQHTLRKKGLSYQ